MENGTSEPTISDLKEFITLKERECQERIREALRVGSTMPFMAEQAGYLQAIRQVKDFLNGVQNPHDEPDFG